MKVTHVGKYIFKLQSDGEATFFLNDKILINKSDRDLDWRGEGTSRFQMSITSDPIFLNIDSFYRIKIEYKHSCNWKFKDKRSYLSLNWAMEVVKKETRPRKNKYDRWGGGGSSTLGSSTLITRRRGYALLDSGFGGGDIQMNADWLKIIQQFTVTDDSDEYRSKIKIIG